MRLLVSNDDGIYAPGLRTLVKELKKEHEVHIVAPECEQSAIGHAITIHTPLRVQEVFEEGELFGYAVDGTPADCIKIALKSLLDFTPDMVISGINQGGNYATNIIYSGTVSAATEGRICGIPSLAISYNSFEHHEGFKDAACYIVSIIDEVYTLSLPSNVFLNINYPDIAESKIKGVKLAPQGDARFIEEFEKRKDPRGNDYYWMAGEMETAEEGAETDYHSVQEGYITITPICYDLTHQQTLKKLNNLKNFQRKRL